MRKGSSFLPSVNFVATAIAVSFVVVLVVLASRAGDHRSYKTTGGDTLVVVSGPNTFDTQVTEIDSDNDGLKDWEEVLWKTSSNNPDTDGDGTSDGDEVSLRRDPLVAGPNDELNKGSFFATSNPEELTETGIFARSVFSRYAQLKQAGITFDEQTAAGLASSIAQDIPTTIPGRRLYAPTNLSIGTDDSTEARRTYGNVVANALSIDTLDGLIVAPNESLTSEPVLRALRTLSLIYGRAESVLLQTSVPPSALSVHVALLNSVNAVASDIDALLLIDTEPIIAIVALTSYQSKDENDLSLALSRVRGYLSLSGISFNQNEPGYTLFNEI